MYPNFEKTLVNNHCQVYDFKFTLNTHNVYSYHLFVTIIYDFLIIIIFIKYYCLYYPYFSNLILY
jgi:hypothetical protein